jgi:Flp pilus assembly protein protease CpaA
MAEALPAARHWAAKTGTAFVSLAALYALGEMGAGEDVETLRAKLSARPKDEKRVAMLAAIKRIEQRQTSNLSH